MGILNSMAILISVGDSVQSIPNKIKYRWGSNFFSIVDFCKVHRSVSKDTYLTFRHLTPIEQLAKISPKIKMVNWRMSP